MAYSSDLFDLIKSLTKAEKRYFKLYSQFQGGEKQYIKVFDYMDKAEVYDEEALLNHFEGEAFTKKFHVLKNYLHSLILKSIRSKGAGSVDAKIQNGLADAMFLRQKGLYDQQKKMLERILKLAEKYDRKTYQLEILAELRSNSIEFTNKGFQEQTLALSEQLLKTVQRLEHELYLENIYDQVFVMSRKQRILRSQARKLQLENVVAPVVKMPPNGEASFRERYRYHYIMAVYYRLVQQADSYKQHIEKAIALWDDHVYMIEEYHNEYRLILSNYLSSCLSNGSFKKFEYYLSKIQSLPCRSFNEEAEQFQNIFFYQLLYLINLGRVDQVNELIPQIEAGLNKYQMKVNKARELALIYTITSFLFVSGNFEEALNWNMKITTGVKVDHRRDIQQFARMMELIIHYELGNHQYLSNLLSSTYKALKKKDDLHDYERLILRYMKKIPFTPSTKEQEKLLRQFQLDLITYEKNHPDQKPLGIKELSIWLKAGITGQTIAKIYSESVVSLVK